MITRTSRNSSERPSGAIASAGGGSLQITFPLTKFQRTMIRSDSNELPEVEVQIRDSGVRWSRRAALTLFAMGCAGLASPRRGWGSPEIPGLAPTSPIALVGGAIYPVTGPAIPAGIVLFDKGRIVAVGPNVPIPADAVKVDVTGKRIYPGLFDAHTNLGLLEINSVRATIDDSETGSINPNVRSIVAVNPDSEHIPVTRGNGVLLALTAPSGGIIAGRSSVIQLDGWTWEDLAVKTDVAMHIHWPNMTPPRDQIGARDRALQELHGAFEAAANYRVARGANPDAHPRDARWEALLGVLDGKLPVLAHADEQQQIEAAVAFAQKWNVKLIIYGGYDAPRVATLLRDRKIPVIVAGTYRLPLRKSDDYDASYTVPARLQQLGVSFCIASAGRFGASDVRNLPFQAGNAVAYGLDANEALKAVTLYPAQILGVADRVGSIESGKDATLIVTNGDPLETPTQIESAYVQGRLVELNDRHKRLFRKYQEKYRRQG